MTKRYRTLFWIFTIVSILLNIGPTAAYVITGLIQSTAVTEKVTLSMTLLIVLIMSIISWVNKTTMRSKIWVLIIGLYFCLDNIITPLLIIGITQIIDEWIISPLVNNFKLKLTINKELDKRAI